jgi:hypothetical protein
MRSILAAAVLSLVACGGTTGGDDGDDGKPPPDACVGLECKVVNCGAQQKPPTTLTGTVFAPNGTLPLFGVNVYVPREPLGPFPEGAQCSRCSDELPGSPIVRTQTDDKGNFILENVPAAENITLVVTSGKWRRQYTIATVPQCVTTAVDPQFTRFPKNKSEGDIPKIALTTGHADSLECLLRKLGISDEELTSVNGAGRVNYFQGAVGDTDHKGVAGKAGDPFADARTLWGDAAKLKTYDIVFLSCEGDQVEAQKPLTSMMNMKGYADIGGRVFASHWHNIWLGGDFKNGNGNVAIPEWKAIARWNGNDGNPGNPIIIDEASNGKGPAFAQWMLNVGGSTVRDQIELVSGTGRATSTFVDGAKAEKWVNTKADTPQMFQFTTPNEVVADQRCGKVVFSDMHVSGTSNVDNNFPDSCPGGAGNLDLTPQEKALAFMFFDIASCVGGIF